MVTAPRVGEGQGRLLDLRQFAGEQTMGSEGDHSAPREIARKHVLAAGRRPEKDVPPGVGFERVSEGKNFVPGIEQGRDFRIPGPLRLLTPQGAFADSRG